MCRDFELPEEAKAHLDENQTPEQFVDRLMRGKLYSDAIRFLAYALPKREAVWWACLCVRDVPPCYGDEISAGALAAAETWFKDPAEANREAAMAATKTQKFEMPAAPAAWAAMAAGWTSGWHPALDETASVRGKNLTAHAVCGAILLAAGTEPERTTKVQLAFMETGVDIATGKKTLDNRRT